MIQHLVIKIEIQKNLEKERVSFESLLAPGLRSQPLIQKLSTLTTAVSDLIQHCTLPENL